MITGQYSTDIYALQELPEDRDNPEGCANDVFVELYTNILQGS